MDVNTKMSCLFHNFVDTPNCSVMLTVVQNLNRKWLLCWCVSSIKCFSQQSKAVSPYMRYGCGVEATAVIAKIANIENMSVWFHSCSAVEEQHAAALQKFFCTPWSDLCHCHRAFTAESGCDLQSRHFVCVWLFWTLINSYQNFQDASNHDEGWLRKNELKLYEDVIGTVFRPLFNGIVQPKALLSF